MSRAKRVELIEQLQQARGGTHLITYITSTRGGIDVPMAMDVVPVVYRHLEAIETEPDQTRIDLFIHSNGGEGVVPWRLVTLIREFCSEFTVLVPNRAFSAATLTALGADTVLMHPMGMLGPTDPTVANEFNPPNDRVPGQLLGISVEDVTSYIALVKEDVGITHEDELVQAFLALAEKVHPIALGNVKRSNQQSRMMGEKLLRSRKGGKPLDDHAIGEIVRKLTSELYFHGHPINRQEARDDVGLPFVEDAPEAVERAMWALYSSYDETMRLNDQFQPLFDAIKKNPLPVPVNPQVPSIANVTFDDAIKGVYVESASRCDVVELEFDVTLRRDVMGTYQSGIGQLRHEWTTESGPDEPTSSTEESM